MDGLQPHCRECNRSRSRAYYHRNREHHKEVVRKNNVAYRRERQIWLLSILITKSCVDCGESDPIVLDFDHVRGKKAKAISQMVNHGTSRTNILREIEKCEVRCANCHRRKTAKQLGWYRLRDGIAD